MFKALLYTLSFLAVCGCQSNPKSDETKVYFERSWARKTTQPNYEKQRNLNRMRPLLTEKLVIQANGTDTVAAYNRSTGNKVWDLYLENGVEAGAAISENKLFFGSNDGFFYSIDSNNGQVLWKVDLKSESSAEPHVQGNYVYHSTNNNALYAFEASTGRILWVKTQGQKSDFTLRGAAKPAFHNGKIFVGFSDGTFKSFDAISGNENWSLRLGDDKKFTDVDAEAVVAEDCLLVSSFANSLFCINADKGQVKWTVPEGGIQKVTYHKNQIYYPTAQNNILVIDPKSGKILKKITTDKSLLSPLTPFNNWFLFTQNKGGVAILDSVSGKLVEKFETGRGAFSEVGFDELNREVYFVSNDANLYKLKIKTNDGSKFPWSSAQ